MGLSKCISEFFHILEANIENMARESVHANKVLTGIYQRPEHAEAGKDALERHLFSVSPYRKHLAQLKYQANQFRLSLDTLFASKSKVIERFVHSLVREVRTLYAVLDEDINHWVTEALTPLTHHNMYQKQLLERHMMRLANLNNENRGIDGQLKDLRANIVNQENALDELAAVIEKINLCTPEGVIKPHNVVSLDAARRAATGL